MGAQTPLLGDIVLVIVEEVGKAQLPQGMGLLPQEAAVIHIVP